MRVLGIETSCDETGIGIYDDIYGLLSNKVHSQAKLHDNYGGVVPELASRHHLHHVVPLIQSALKEANISKSRKIDVVAYTAGPGLVGPLLVGATIGRALAFAWNIPAVPINHMEGHLLSPALEGHKPQYPYLALLVSGGHTQLIGVESLGKYDILGNSIDDAAGEVFDKVAKSLGLKYPGGPMLSRLAKYGVPGRFVFPRPMTDQPGLNFSFSGLKTSAINTINKQCNTNNSQIYADIARAFEDAVVDTLIIKCKRAIEQHGFKQLVITGGVGANNTLRKSMLKVMQNYGVEVFFVHPSLCTDNGAMIAYVGMIRFQQHTTTYNDLSIVVRPRWSIGEIN